MDRGIRWMFSDGCTSGVSSLSSLAFLQARNIQDDDSLSKASFPGSHRGVVSLYGSSWGGDVPGSAPWK